MACDVASPSARPTRLMPGSPTIPRSTELLLGPIVPSNTARGSIVMAVVTSLCRTLGASPEKNRKSHGGEYLVLVGSHANLIAAATYQTGT